MPLFLPSGSSQVSFIQLLDSRANGSTGGAATFNAWTARPLNTIKADQTNNVLLVSNAFTLPNGTYIMDCVASFYATYYSRLRLRNVTDDVVILNSLNGWTPVATGYSQLLLPFSGMFSINANKSLQLEYKCTSGTSATTNIGFPSNHGIEEIYTVLNFLKIA